MAIKTSKDAIDTVNDALKLYNEVLDRIVPWKDLKEALKKLDTSAAEYSYRSADLVGNIKTHLLNTIDAYDGVTQNIYEWCGLSTSLLTTYAKLFNDGNTSKQTAQKTLVVKVLENGMKQMEKAQRNLDVCTTNLNKTSEYLTSLGTQLYNESDENSEYFRHKMGHIKRESHEAAAEISGPSGATGIASTLIEEKLTREFKERLNSIREFHENLKVTVDQAFVGIEQTEEKLNDKLQKISELKSRVAETKTYALIDNVAELCNSLIESTQILIAKCNEYRNKHAL